MTACPDPGGIFVPRCYFTFPNRTERATIDCRLAARRRAELGIASELRARCMLRVTNLSCVRGERPLFAGLDFAVEPGEWLRVGGANGSGKTSLLRLLAGLSQPAEGEISWCGRPVAADVQAYRGTLLFVGHLPALKEDLTSRENLQFASELDGARLTRQEALAALLRLGLQGCEDLPVRFLSAGQKRRVLLARLVSRKARLWLLDEPFTALDGRASGILGAVIAEHFERGGMAVITSHQDMPVPADKVLDL